jgi:predicted phage tail protein
MSELLVDRFGKPIQSQQSKDQEAVEALTIEELDGLREDLMMQARALVTAFNDDQIEKDEFETNLNEMLEKIAAVDGLRSAKMEADREVLCTAP